MTKKVKEKKEFWATGRRKTAIARVRLSAGSGAITVNDKPAQEYFGREALQLTVQEPFAVSGTAGKYDAVVNVVGSGTASQSEAVRHGISRALTAMDTELRKSLKTAGFLTRDSREKERRKVGRRKARRRPQYSKR